MLETNVSKFDRLKRKARVWVKGKILTMDNFLIKNQDMQRNTSPCFNLYTQQCYRIFCNFKLGHFKIGPTLSSHTYSPDEVVWPLIVQPRIQAWKSTVISLIFWFCRCRGWLILLKKKSRCSYSSQAFLGKWIWNFGKHPMT